MTANHGTGIEWTHRPGTKGETWNPIRARNRATGGVGHFCVKVSDGCKNCYAERLQPRFNNPVRYAAQDENKVEIYLDEKTLLAPLRWKKPRTVFVCSMSDLFMAGVSDDMIDRIFAVMALCSQHTFIVLSKRAERMRGYFFRLSADDIALDGLGRWHAAAAPGYGNLVDDAAWIEMLGNDMPLPNVWLGVSAEDQVTADERIPRLLETPAAVRFVSAEPLLGLLDLSAWLHLLDWIIAGGESGHCARPMDPYLPRLLRKQCKAASVPFFFKQWGEWVPGEDKYSGDPFFYFQNGEALDSHLIPNEGDENDSGAFKHEPFPHAYTDWEEAGAEPDYEPPSVLFHRVGKHRAGNHLDGHQHLEWPGVAG